MKKTWLIAGSSLVIGMAMAALLVMVHPTLARGEEAKGSGAEVKVDNFTFGPDTL